MLQRTVNLVEESIGERVDLNDLSLEDEKTYDTYDLNEDPHDPPFLHIQSISDITLKRGSKSFEGIGVLEELILGPHKPSGFKDLFDR